MESLVSSVGALLPQAFGLPGLRTMAIRVPATLHPRILNSSLHMGVVFGVSMQDTCCRSTVGRTQLRSVGLLKE